MRVNHCLHGNICCLCDGPPESECRPLPNRPFLIPGRPESNVGFHTCQLCPKGGPGAALPETSSGEYTITFASGRTYHFPDMLFHYILEHNYHPPMEFVEDVMNGKPTSVSADHSRKTGVVQVGWLTEDFPKLTPSLPFLVALAQLMRTYRGCRVQTRGMPRP